MYFWINTIKWSFHTRGSRAAGITLQPQHKAGGRVGFAERSQCPDVQYSMIYDELPGGNAGLSSCNYTASVSLQQKLVCSFYGHKSRERGPATLLKLHVNVLFKNRWSSICTFSNINDLSFIYCEYHYSCAYVV